MNALYRFFDSADRLLYIGSTVNIGARLNQHASSKVWWPEVARITIEKVAANLREAEAAAIRDERPLYNVVHNRSRHLAVSSVAARRLAAGLHADCAYALGLFDGECPVGLVIDGDESGVTIARFSWLTGAFGHEEQWVAASRIAEWRRARVLSAAEAREQGWLPAGTSVVFDMDPLGEFQTWWKERPGGRG